MAKGSKLLAALDREKGVDHKLERQKKQQKAAEKRKRSRVEDQEDEAVLEDAIKEAEETVSGAAAGKKDKKGAKRAKVEQEEDEEEEWETDDEDKTHAVCLSRYYLCMLCIVMLTPCSRKTLQDWSRTIPRTNLIQRTTSTEAPS
jgi:rRNA-processing protein EBP2